MLLAAGIRRINVSLDSRDPERFRHITRHGDLAQVLGGIEAAAAAGLAVKINMVALKGLNEDEIAPMLRWCAERGPRPDADRDDAARRGRGGPHRALSAARRGARSGSTATFRLVPSLAPHRRAGALLRGGGLGIRLGLITPLTGNFCDGCNRIRVAATGTVYRLPRPRPEGRAARPAAQRRRRSRQRSARPAARRQAQGP